MRFFTYISYILVFVLIAGCTEPHEPKTIYPSINLEDRSTNMASSHDKENSPVTADPCVEIRELARDYEQKMENSLVQVATLWQRSGLSLPAEFIADPRAYGIWVHTKIFSEWSNNPLVKDFQSLADIIKTPPHHNLYDLFTVPFGGEGVFMEFANYFSLSTNLAQLPVIVGFLLFIIGARFNKFI